MAGEFDPYHRWLGIGPEHQPPDHYRLLGIARFESDRQVIDSVALRHISFLQEITDGPCVDQAQRLLNELAAARRCLLDPERKAAYDAELRAVPAGASSSSAASACPEPISVPTFAAGGRGGPRSRSTGNRRRGATSRRRLLAPFAAAWQRLRSRISGSGWGPIGAAGVAALLLLLVGWWSGRESSSEVVEPPGAPRPAGERPLVDPRLSSPGPVSSPDRPPSPAVAVGQPSGPDPGAGRMETAESGSPSEGVKTPTSPRPAGAAGIEASESRPESSSPDSRSAERLKELARMAGPAPTGEADSAARRALPLPLQTDGLRLWLDAADLATVQTDAAGRIRRWEDKSFEGFAAEVESGGRGPTWSPAGEPPAVRFEGAEYLTLARTASPLNLDADYTWLFVAAGASGGLMSKGSGESPGSFLLAGDGQLTIGGRDFSPPREGELRLRVRTVVASREQLRWYVDGQPQSAYPGTEHAIRTQSVLRLGCVWQRAEGAQQLFQGELAELMLFDRALSAEERTGLEEYLRAKWCRDRQAGPLPFSSSHPPEQVVPQEVVAASDTEPDDRSTVPREEEEAEEQESPDRAAQEGDHDESSEHAPPWSEETPWTEAEEPSADALIVWHINLGGEGYEDAQGNRWLPSRRFDGQDFGHEGGRLASGGAPLYPDQPWAETAIRDLTAFRAVLPNGTYEVTLCFCEHWTTDPDRRLFLAVFQRGSRNSVRLNFHGPGMGRPWTHTVRRVAVTEGSLAIEFSPLIPDSLPILNAIIIRQLRARR